jgi:type IV secretory pathway TrbF-like protein
VFNKTKPKSKPLTLSEIPGAPPGVFNDPAGEFAEVYGKSKVGEQRLFIVALLAIILSCGAVLALFITAQKSVTVPVLVEFNSDTGVVNKPVIIEHIRPTQAVIKAEIGRWATKILSIDSIQTPRMMREANAMTKGLGTQQYTEFRVKQNILERMTKDKTLERTVKVNSVDISQEGVAFVFVTTKEVKGTELNGPSARFRLTLKYELIPPQSEDEIMINPLGIYITAMNAIEEAAQK